MDSQWSNLWSSEQKCRRMRQLCLIAFVLGRFLLSKTSNTHLTAAAADFYSELQQNIKVFAAYSHPWQQIKFCWFYIFLVEHQKPASQLRLQLVDVKNHPKKPGGLGQHCPTARVGAQRSLCPKLPLWPASWGRSVSALRSAALLHWSMYCSCLGVLVAAARGCGGVLSDQSQTQLVTNGLPPLADLSHWWKISPCR